MKKSRKLKRRKIEKKEKIMSKMESKMKEKGLSEGQKSEISHLLRIRQREVISSLVSMIFLCLFFTMILPIEMAYAGHGFDKLVKDVFPKGTMNNSTSSAIVREQSAGHYIGGSAVIKAPAEPPLQLVHAMAPSCKMGGLPCGAQFELMGGALSVVSSQELMRYLKELPKAAATYGGMMAIKTLCPQCQDIMEWLDAKADLLNQLSMDHCKMNQMLMGPLFPKEQAKRSALKQSNMLLTGEKKDAASIQSDSKKGEVGPLHEDLKSQLGENYNIVWKALEKKLQGTGSDREFKELLMSISGTIIGTKDAEGRMSVRHVKSLISKDLIREFIGFDGLSKDKVKLFRCDDTEKCLNPKPELQDVASGAFFFTRVKEIMESIIKKIHNDNEEYSKEEETFIALSSDQIIPRIEHDLAVYSDQTGIINNQRIFIEALAYEAVTNYMQELLVSVQEAVGELSHAQMSDADKFRAFALETREVMRLLESARKEARAKFESSKDSKEKVRHEKAAQNIMIEKHVTKE